MDRYIELKEEMVQVDDDTTSKISSSRVDYEGALYAPVKQDEIEIGYFHLLNCDIKASEDMIR
jgi:hypothetical protein